MIIYRLVESSDWPNIIKLTNQIFQESISMEKSFPLLFDISNTFSYVAVENNKIIGFIGVLPEELVVNNQEYYGSRIGAVCISADHQGQGIGRSLFRVMKAEANDDFILVSGQGKLYLQEGCELFGEFQEFLIKPKSNDMELLEYDGKLNQLLMIHNLLKTKESYFEKSLIQLQQLITAHSLENLWQGKQTVYLGLEEGVAKSVVITCTRQEGTQKITEVLEFGGEKRALLKTLEKISLVSPNLRIRVFSGSDLAAFFEETQTSKSVQNAGTCLFNNKELKNVQIPHTWDLGFL